jgi:hypothetical protein
MIDLDAMNKDQWQTWPVKKEELRGLVHEIERLRAALQRIVDYGLVSSADLDRAFVVLGEGKADG